MIKKRRVWGKINNYHLYAAIIVYVVITGFQIGLPETFANTRDILTLVQLVLMLVLSVLIIVNLVRNWE